MATALPLCIILLGCCLCLEVAKGQPYYDPEGNYYDLNPSAPDVGVTSEPSTALAKTTSRASGNDSKDSHPGVSGSHYYDEFMRRDDVPDVKYLEDTGASKEEEDYAPLPRAMEPEMIFNHAYKNNATQPPRSTFAQTDGLMVRISNRTQHEAGNISCDVVSNAGCDVIHYERCDPKTRSCQCLKGFLRETAAGGQGACKAASFYHGHLTVNAPGVDQSYSVEQLQPIKWRLMTLIQLTFTKQNIRGVLDLDIHSIEKQGQRMTLKFELTMDKSLTSGLGEIQNVLSQQLMVTPRGDMLLESEVKGALVNNSEYSSLFSPLVEINPCINSDHNYCSTHAICSYVGDAVTCQCENGFDDPTPNLYRLPGEHCVEKCHCQNGGLCVDDDILSGTKQCSCLKWYFGTQCEIDGKEVLVICCSSIGSLVVLSLLLCCCYYFCSKHKDSNVRSRMLHFSPDISILKLPRVWMDTTTSFHEHELSPENNRRISITSESNPYFDGYILEDIPLSTLPRHAEAHSPYYQTTLGHHQATMSSHSFYRY
ncbi:uncharacterized protein LOC106074200 [Biomphalaria glabrata]|uniref:Uncharacterized protein LOC106074200 n=1 Tax=Biomphalaria glabrata TaxID=6526 RepID=A0A9W3AB34_BIOGL|nr:uncharacterized protein LOC106074200 [Biomphalaria glabrata]